MRAPANTARHTLRVLCAIALWSLPVLLEAQRNLAAEIAIGDAIQKEVVDGDLQAAIREYKQVVAQYPAARSVVAEALVRMAGCYRTLRLQPEARGLYQQVVDEYADQKRSAAEAAAALAALGSSGGGAIGPPRLVCSGCGDERGSMTPDVRWMALTDRTRSVDAHGLAIRDMSTGKLSWLTEGGPANSVYDPSQISYPIPSPDRRKVVYAWTLPEGRTQLRVIANTSGASPEVVLDDPQIVGVTPVAWSLDNKKILIATESTNHSTEISWLTLENRDRRRIRSLGWRRRGVNGRPALSPDGRYVAYAALAREPGTATGPLQSKDQHIYVIASNGSGAETEVVSGKNINESPVWTPDSTKILFLSNRVGREDVFDLRFIYFRDGKAEGPARDVSPDVGCCISPHVVSPDGLLYYTRRQKREDLTYIVEMEAGGARIKGPGVHRTEMLEGRLPAWSPADSETIATKRQSPNGQNTWDLLVYSLRTRAEARRYSPPGAARSQVVWLRDGTGILDTVTKSGVTSVYRVDVETGHYDRLVDHNASTLTGTMAQFSDVSRDGATLYTIASDKPGAPINRIVAVDLNSGQRKPVYTLSHDAVALRLSPDGRTLAVVGIDETRTYLSLVGVDGVGYREIWTVRDMRLHQVIQAPSWTSEGRGLLFLQEDVSSLHLTSAAIADYLVRLRTDPAVMVGARNPNMTTRQRVMYVSAEGVKPAEPTGLEIESGSVSSISLNKDGSRLAYGLRTGAADLWTLDLFSILQMN